MPRASRKATIYDIARLSGASASTVSAALGESWRERRISEATVEAIRSIAAAEGYSANMQARGLRKARSGLVGMVIPLHDNRFFSSMSQSFEAFARERGLVPVIASSMREPGEERRIVETLITYAVDYMFIAGATDPDAVSAMCNAANLRHVFVDLPGRGAPSVVSDNYKGAADLTRRLLTDRPISGGTCRDRLYFIGGDPTDYASARRIEAFRDALTEAGSPPGPGQIIACGYAPRSAMREIAALCDRLGGLPAGVLVNSLTAFEGVLGHLSGLPLEDLRSSVIGCYDYDPFAAYLQFPVHMVRQDAHGLIREAYRIIDQNANDLVLRMVEPEQIAPRTFYDRLFSDHG
ncbi:MAG: LacI family DNA-binding transcriptional regulator [Rhodobacter sp.]|nr:LacI family DNA-binding transcriptional regulator [Rhodobacter sp.]MCA3456956.1 LacI family DNA-binding transcriptional regulator [Rhodobacter sp.]MCA3460090.1 LacI family DNA-binding transcriptional regulator [Rhodobacter sp.]MCA3465458.1 LacI family DNA-binding transcriptional regulator [Rhodobacter sp.]MCA3468373.1 LacI family DNA-binding transcriptional regulator [Rhodobacter sp.]